jgi:RNA polymerase sigma factor (TIGR02999 family)
MQPEPENVTQLLAALRDGNSGARTRLIEMVYPELRRIALRHMQRERPGHTLQATALVNEAWLRLNRQDKDWKNRAHFFAVAAQVMRQILVDYARQHRAARRGGGVAAEMLDECRQAGTLPSDKILALDEALSRLAEWGPRQSRVVELRFFGGLSEEETGEVLEISTRTVKRDWKLARAWLYAQIGK